LKGFFEIIRTNPNRFSVSIYFLKVLGWTSTSFEVDMTRKAEILYGVIQHCLKNNVSYNYLLDKNFAAFLSKALQKEEITSKDVDVHPRTFKKYIETLNRFGLVLMISKKPLRAKIFYNILLNNLLVYFDYKHEVITESSHIYDKEIERELNIFKRLRKKNENGKTGKHKDLRTYRA
ncbi:hypothetical protein KJ878_01435, partial [Patescibacteria group bacterium]|nr:hypothetical protein [Patescibacteria group bacterium]